MLDDLRLLYVPIPKSGSTAILGALAGVAGVSEADFARSRKLEVTRELAIHDMSIWGASFTLANRPADELEWILGSPDWLRFTVVREPRRRIWSAWVSKVLVRDPRFTAAFGDEPWFPAAPRTSEDVLGSFRRFARALPSVGLGSHDPHWARQVDLLGLTDLGYGHVGRLERIADTVAFLGEYLERRGRTLPPVRPANRSLLPFAPGVFDRPALEACAPWTTSASEVFGYEPAQEAGPPDAAWHTAVNATIPAIHAVIERHERIADLRRMVRDGERAAA